MKPKLKKFLPHIIIVVLCMVLYGNTIPNRYSLDDNLVTSLNPKIKKGMEAIPEILTTNYHESYDFHFGYRPVTQITYAFEYAVFGDQPHISHFINILIYIITGLLLFAFLRKIFNDKPLMLPLLITIIFIAHPVHTEVVASLKNREELLSLMFALLSALLFVSWFHGRKWYTLAAAGLCFLLGYLSKENIMVFVLIIPLTLVFFSGLKVKKAAIILLVMGVVVFLTRRIINHYLPSENQSLYFENPLFYEGGIINKLALGFYSLGYYLKIMIYPHPLLYYYGYSKIEIPVLWDSLVLLSAFLHLLLFVTAIYFRKKRKILSFGILFYLISVFMFSNIYVPVNGIIGERLVYFASIGFSIAAGYLIFSMIRKHENGTQGGKGRILIYAATGLLLILFSIKTITRNKDWKSDLSLYEHDMEFLDKSAKANGIYATKLLFELSRNRDAADQNVISLIIKHYKRSVEIFPDYYSSWNNIGYVYLITGKDPEKALPYIDKALEIKPEYPEALFSKGLCYEMKGEYEKAAELYKKAMDINPHYVDAIVKTANWNNKNGNVKEAIELNKRLVRMEPSLDIPWINVGNYFFMRTDTVNALKYWEKAYEINPENYYMLVNLVNLNRQLGNMQKYNFYNGKLNSFSNRNKTRDK